MNTNIRFEKDEVSRVEVTFPKVTKESLAAAVKSFADVVDFTPNADDPHRAIAQLKFNSATVIEGSALHFGHPAGTLVFVSATTVKKGVSASA